MVDTTTSWIYAYIDMEVKDIQRTLSDLRREKESLTQSLKKVEVAQKAMEDLLGQKLIDNAPPMSVRAAILQVIRGSNGEPLHVKDVLQQIEALGAQVRSSTNDKPSVVDLGIYSLKKQGLPVERVATRTWKYLGGEAADFKTAKARKKRPRRATDYKTGGEATG